MPSPFLSYLALMKLAGRPHTEHRPPLCRTRSFCPSASKLMALNMIDATQISAACVHGHARSDCTSVIPERVKVKGINTTQPYTR